MATSLCHNQPFAATAVVCSRCLCIRDDLIIEPLLWLQEEEVKEALRLQDEIVAKELAAKERQRYILLEKNLSIKDTI